MMDLGLAAEIAPAPKTAPRARHPDQMELLPSPVSTTYGPLTMNLAISLHRTARQKCTNCGNRRICYFVGLGDVLNSPSLCAKCAGIR